MEQVRLNLGDLLTATGYRNGSGPSTSIRRCARPWRRSTRNSTQRNRSRKTSTAPALRASTGPCRATILSHRFVGATWVTSLLEAPKLRPWVSCRTTTSAQLARITTSFTPRPRHSKAPTGILCLILPARTNQTAPVAQLSMLSHARNALRPAPAVAGRGQRLGQNGAGAQTRASREAGRLLRARLTYCYPFNEAKSEGQT